MLNVTTLANANDIKGEKMDTLSIILDYEAVHSTALRLLRIMFLKIFTTDRILKFTHLTNYTKS